MPFWGSKPLIRDPPSSPRFSQYRFGVEIEVIAEPKKKSSYDDYQDECDYQYLFLAIEMRGLGLSAEREERRDPYKSNQDFTRWTIMKDTSLEGPEKPENAVALEAVSPIFETDDYWQGDIDKFWEAHNEIFYLAEPSLLAGFHIHISPQYTAFTLDECKAIAFGSVYYDAYIYCLLPHSRRDNTYCMPNTLESHDLSIRSVKQIKNLIRKIETRKELIEVMQGVDKKRRRYMLWNFENLVPKRGRPEGSQSGTIEFRGGRGMRGPVRTKRWIAFIIAFVDLCLKRFNSPKGSQSRQLKKIRGVMQPQEVYLSPLESFYSMIRCLAEYRSMEDYLPQDWQPMNESHREGPFDTSVSGYNRLPPVPKDDEEEEEEEESSVEGGSDLDEDSPYAESGSDPDDETSPAGSGSNSDEGSPYAGSGSDPDDETSPPGSGSNSDEGSPYAGSDTYE